MKVNWKTIIMLAAAIPAAPTLLLIPVAAAAAAAPDPQLADDLIFVGNGSGNSIKVIDVDKQAVVNTIGAGSGMDHNHGVLLAGRYVFTANETLAGGRYRVVKYDLGSLSPAAVFTDSAVREQYNVNDGLCGIEFDRNDPTRNIWALSMSSTIGNGGGGAYELNPDTGFTGGFIDTGTGSDNRATCGIGWDLSGAKAYASLMLARKTVELNWLSGSPTGRSVSHDPTIHIMDTNKNQGLVYITGGNYDGVGSKIDIVDMSTMKVINSVQLPGYNPHSVTLAHNNGFLYAHSREVTGGRPASLLIFDTGGGSAGGSPVNPVMIAAIPDGGASGSCGSDIGKKSDYCSKPDLEINKTKVYWANIIDFVMRQLSVDFSVKNTSALAGAHKLSVSSTENSNEVIGASSSGGGNIPGGGGSFTVKYQIPIGVSSFDSKVHANTKDLCNDNFTSNAQINVSVPLLPL